MIFAPNNRTINRNQRKNPNRICTWNPGAPCDGSGVAGRLLCKWDGRALRAFLVLGLSFTVPALTAYEYVSRLF
jgi:hypothetical protein